MDNFSPSRMLTPSLYRAEVTKYGRALQPTCTGEFSLIRLWFPKRLFELNRTALPKLGVLLKALEWQIQIPERRRCHLMLSKILEPKIEVPEARQSPSRNELSGIAASGSPVKIEVPSCEQPGCSTREWWKRARA
jgi:hypothetical protein